MSKKLPKFCNYQSVETVEDLCNSYFSYTCPDNVIVFVFY